MLTETGFALENAQLHSRVEKHLKEIEERNITLEQEITERKRTENKLITTLRELEEAKDMVVQSEKFAAIGQLTAGVAHEILNPVNIISMELQILRGMQDISPDVHEEVSVCMDQIARIVSIAENLKQFSRIPVKTTVMADINNVVAHVLALYSTQLKIEEIETAAQYQSDLPKIPMDKEKIEQVIINLITNAMAAMEGKEVKILRIKTERESPHQSNDQIKIMIADNGTGIKTEHMSKIFDPFFTTKGQGKGTGLGLSISYGIVHDHGGTIWAENNEWGGASFYVKIPVKTDIDNARKGD
jgi:C4-dicarboxylate-specific signal transduction histidine kinase